MTRIFIVGLPQSERRRIESQLLKRHILGDILPCDWGNQGEYVLLPHPSHAIHSLWDYCKTIGDGFGDARIFVLPYASLPGDLLNDLAEMAEMGANVTYFQQEVGGWPFLKRRQRLDQPKSSTIGKLILEAIGGEDAYVTPSQYIATAMAACPRLIVVSNAIASCDLVTQQRHPFIKNGIDALVEIIHLEGRTDGSMESFFSSRALTLAQSGGDSIELEVFQSGKPVHKEKSSIHLKEGDATAPQNCPRIYYQATSLASGYYVFLLYVGPHRNGDFSKVLHLNPA